MKRAHGSAVAPSRRDKKRRLERHNSAEVDAEAERSTPVGRAQPSVEEATERPSGLLTQTMGDLRGQDRG